MNLLHLAEPSYRGLIGRSAETAVLASVVRHSATTGAALLVSGEPGVGKSALLEAAAQDATASGTTVLRAAGVDFEAEIDFAGLHQLLLPLLDELGALPEPHRDALAIALGSSRGRLPEGLLVSAASLALLRRSAGDRPVLLVVDDLPWLDRASTTVLGFIARRLGGSRIGFLGAIRTGSDCVLLHSGLPQLDLTPMDATSAGALLSDRFPALPAAIRQRVLSAAEGNPRALLELPEVLTAEQRAGSAPLPRSLPLGTSLRGVFARRLGKLPAATRDLMLLIALDVSGDLRTLRAAAGDDHWLDGLAPAERDRLVRVDIAGQRVSLRHPLIGAAVVELSTSSERRRAHRALANALVDHPERCAWHLVQSAVGPDACAADLLELAARRSQQKGDSPRSIHSLLQAAHLTPTGPERARRLAEAAFAGADTTGYLRNVPALLSEAHAADPHAAGSLEVAAAAAHHLLNGDGDVDTAHLVLVRALQHARTGAPDRRALEDALHSLMLVCHYAGREELWEPFERALAELGGDVPPVLAVSAGVFADPARATPEAFDGLDELVTAVQGEADQARVVRVGTAAFYTGRLAGCRPALRRVVADGRSGGAVASAVKALMMLSHDARREGRWDEAVRTAEEGISRGERLGYGLLATSGLYCQALVASARGHGAAAESSAARLAAWSVSRGVGLFSHFAHHVRASTALGRGEFEDAYRHLTSISPAGGFAPHAPVAVWVAMDLVEAAARTGRRAEAEKHVAAMRRASIFDDSPWPAMISTGSAALVASGTEATRLFETALATPGADRHPFDQARIRLAYGEHLRRTRATTAARRQLTSALESFVRLGAAPWQTRAANELAAAGSGHRPVPAGDRRPTLTAQEYEIAMLAASGLSNKQIGSRLYLSPRTVGAHLYRVFPKLGINSRAALRDALSAAGSTITPVPSRAG